ncbi:MAG: hypothetical protein ACO3TF_00380 [Burkholderiaceae bacterium]
MVCSIAPARRSRLAVLERRFFQAAAAFLFVLLTASLTGCGQVMDRIQGKPEEKLSSKGTSSSAGSPSPSARPPIQESQEHSPSAEQTAASSSTPAQRPAATTTAAPMTAPTATELKPPNKLSVEVHPPPQGTSSTTTIYRSSDARRP